MPEPDIAPDGVLPVRCNELHRSFGVRATGNCIAAVNDWLSLMPCAECGLQVGQRGKRLQVAVGTATDQHRFGESSQISNFHDWSVSCLGAEFNRAAVWRGPGCAVPGMLALKAFSFA